MALNEIEAKFNKSHSYGTKGYAMKLVEEYYFQMNERKHCFNQQVANF